MLLAATDRTGAVFRRSPMRFSVICRPDDLALSDQSGRELRRTTVFGCRAAQDQRIAAVFHYGLGFRIAVRPTNLGNALMA